MEKPMQGHHISLYGQFLTYDIENGGTGHQSKKTYGAGMEYGYSLPIGIILSPVIYPAIYIG